MRTKVEGAFSASVNSEEFKTFWTLRSDKFFFLPPTKNIEEKKREEMFPGEDSGINKSFAEVGGDEMTKEQGNTAQVKKKNFWHRVLKKVISTQTNSQKKNKSKAAEKI